MRIFRNAKDSHIFSTKNNSVFVIFKFKILTKHLLTRSLISNKSPDQLHVDRAADQHLCFLCIERTIPVILKFKISSLKPFFVTVQQDLCGT